MITPLPRGPFLIGKTAEEGKPIIDKETIRRARRRLETAKRRADNLIGHGRKVRDVTLAVSKGLLRRHEWTTRRMTGLAPRVMGKLLSRKWPRRAESMKRYGAKKLEKMYGTGSTPRNLYIHTMHTQPFIRTMGGGKLVDLMDSASATARRGIAQGTSRGARYLYDFLTTPRGGTDSTSTSELTKDAGERILNSLYHNKYDYPVR